MVNKWVVCIPLEKYTTLEVFHYTLGWLRYSQISTVHMAVGKSVNIRAIQGIMENFQCSSAPPNIKYNCVVLLLSQLYILLIYASKYFLIDHHYKRYIIIYDLLAKGVRNRTDTIENNKSWCLSLSLTSVNISTAYCAFHLVPVRVPVP